MKNLFVFTAINPEAKQHIKDTVENPIPKEKVERHFSGAELSQIKKIGNEFGYHAWGALPGPVNTKTWKAMEIGDHILIYQDKAYTFYSRVLFKTKSVDFAVDNWGKNAKGETWEYRYLFEKPIKFEPPVKAPDLSKYLHKSYMGFTKISNEKISNIVTNYGSLEGFLNKKFPNLEIKVKKPPKEIDSVTELLLKKGQIILYGPPGTGKTFCTKKHSLKLIGNRK